VSESLVYVGTYTIRGSQGIYAFTFDTNEGNLRPLGLVAEMPNPTFLAVDQAHSMLYAVEETGPGAGGSLRSFRADFKSGKLTPLNTVRSNGTGPCYITFDLTGRWVLTANYHSGSFSIFPLLEDGSLGKISAFVQHEGGSPGSERQQGPHAHAICPAPGNDFVLVADLGIDKVLAYGFDPVTGKIATAPPAFGTVTQGAGPRHLAFHKSGQFLYVLNELDSTVTQFAFDAETASLTNVKTLSSLPADIRGHSHAAHLLMDASGRYLYASNRGHNSIAVFAVDSSDGTLEPVQHMATQGKTPRGFSLDPTGKWLLAGNEDSDSIAIFHINDKTGKLSLTRVLADIPSPVFFAFA
jgi:6-phosphogluconolactonase